MLDLIFIYLFAWAVSEVVSLFLFWCRPGAMKAQGEEGKESFLEENFLEESHLDNGLDCEDDGPEGFSVSECGIVVPPPSHG